MRVKKKWFHLHGNYIISQTHLYCTSVVKRSLLTEMGDFEIKQRGVLKPWTHLDRCFSIILKIFNSRDPAHF